jgi:2-phosphoglycerate kinase
MRKSENNPPNKIVVIGGGSFQGKSLIALHVAYRFKIPIVICTDTVRSILHLLSPEVPYFSTSTYLISRGNLKTQMKEVSKVLKKLLVLYRNRGENIIIEGMHLSQEFIKYLSNKSNVLIFCIDNKLPLEKKLEYKTITRYRVEYLDPETGKIKYGQLMKDNIPFTPYMRHASRIEEIHHQIVNYFIQNNLPIIKFEDIDNAIERIEKMTGNLLTNKGTK